MLWKHNFSRLWKPISSTLSTPLVADKILIIPLAPGFSFHPWKSVSVFFFFFHNFDLVKLSIVFGNRFSDHPSAWPCVDAVRKYYTVIILEKESESICKCSLCSVPFSGLTTVLVHKYCGATQSNIYDFQAEVKSFCWENLVRISFFPGNANATMQESNTDSYSCCTFAFPPPPSFWKRNTLLRRPAGAKSFQSKENVQSFLTRY